MTVLRRLAGILGIVALALLALPAFASASSCGYVDRTLDTPIHIPDSQLASATNSIYIPTSALVTTAVEDVDINVDITHPDPHDLSISISHAGKTIGLSSGNAGGMLGNYTGTIFDDEAATSIVGVPAPATGSFRPETALSGFDGLDPHGLWTITVRDTVGTLSGGGGGGPPAPQELVGWGLRWSASSCPSNPTGCDEVGLGGGTNFEHASAVSTSRSFVGTGTVTGVDVRFGMTEPNDANVAVTLAHSGTTVALVTHRGGAGDNFIRTLFTDAAATGIAAGVAPFTGSFRPEEPLSAFNNQTVAGSWTLNVADSAGGADATFNEWGLRLHLTTCVDPDGDSVWSTIDDCPAVANSDQAFHDFDGTGDACDDDDDGDGVLDTADGCPLGAGSFADPTDTDHDGCIDAGQDADDDNDGVADVRDACPLQTAAPGTDSDGDGCGNEIDADDDGDGVADAADRCPLGVVGPGDDPDANGCKSTEDADGDGVPESRDRCPLGAAGLAVDTDGDGCKDGEDLDDDDDGAPDTADNCPVTANPGQQDADRDGQGDACDVDDDADGLVDSADVCHLLKARTLSGCPAVTRKATLTYTARTHQLRATLSVAAKPKTPACVTAQRVVLHRVRRTKRGKDPTVGKALKTTKAGTVTLTTHLSAGTYYVQVAAVTIPDVAQCSAVTSKRLTVR